ncbi:ARM repeat-containing protein [Microstroma glucosiphilum]|uniref:ARM repeat-containing protein n=1 Tax=Pseudomicrostroma glucosiphilum TaxID=1684307 RepID=A0A316U7B3_9BASI|nr:ARM repeat-containing protein [Pseudomicrostroma glucosiphilum]PWN18835.1 ARM repeat-containing protein [Pseudomicrostroma glucosiphilum]
MSGDASPTGSDSQHDLQPPGQKTLLDEGGGGIVDETDDANLSRFSRAAEFLSLLNRFLASKDDNAVASTSTSTPKDKLLSQLRAILDDYQEQSYLLDPHLEAMVMPPVQALQRAVKSRRNLTSDNEDVCRIARLLYSYAKVRGYKTILRFFPHEVGDVIPTVEALRHFQMQEDNTSDTWELRYVLLLWLSLVCMIPFDLKNFSASIADEIVVICQTFLESPGKERDAAAITLGKLLQRRDTAQTQLPAYIKWCQEKLSPQARPSPFLATGIFQTLCEILKNPSPHLVQPHFEQIQSLVSLGEYGEEDSEALKRLRSNGLVNKLRGKLATRMALTLLRPRKNGRAVARRLLGGGSGKVGAASQERGTEGAQQEEEDEDDDDIPPSIDSYISQLLRGLQDKDTLVRYSSAKGLARICERLPGFFIDQVAEAVTDLFQINVLTLNDGSQDYSAVSEFTWQGACLGLAEMGRRGLLSEATLGEQLEWVKKSLFFDIRRGSHSIGSSVRDAACYVLWALSRSYPSSALIPHALSIAQHLITVALLDREVAIRRAASAAFQECVGRWGLFPHGIAVVGKTDFFSVGVRRVAFLEALPFVASYHEYRPFLLETLLHKTVVHWDPAMRELGAKAVAKVAQLGLRRIVPEIVQRLESNCTSRDSVILHGTLLTLAEVGRLCKTLTEDAKEDPVLVATQRKIFALLDVVPRTTFRSLGGALVLEAACGLIAATASKQALDHHTSSASPPTYDIFIDAALARREEVVHAAAASALEIVSRLVDCSERVIKVISAPKVWRAFSPSQQQSFALALGYIHYPDEGTQAEEQGIGIKGPLLHRSLRFLLALVTVKPGSTIYSSHIETRRNAYMSLVAILQRTGNDLPERVPPQLGQTVLQALVDALSDYTTDQRGDVGSWVRVAAMRGLTTLVAQYRHLFRAGILKGSEDVQAWLPEQLFHAIVCGISKQVMERIDNVRVEAVGHLLSLYRQQPGEAEGLDLEVFPRPHGREYIMQAFFPESSSTTLTPDMQVAPEVIRSPSLLYPRLITLLLIEAYRPHLLSGLLQTLSSRVDVALRTVGPSLVDFALAEADRETYSARDIWRDLLLVAEGREAKIVGGGMMGMSLLLEGGLVDLLVEQRDARTDGDADADGHNDQKGDAPAWRELFERSLAVAMRNVGKIKTHQRLMLSLSLGMNLLAVPFTSVQREVVQQVVGTFLGHDEPAIRRAAAEKLYLVLTSSETLQDAEGEGAQEVEELLLEIPWSEEREFEVEVTKVKEGLMGLIEGPQQ